MLKALPYRRSSHPLWPSPVDHLKKKLFNYVNDYLGGRLGYEDLLKKSLSALTTSLRTNAKRNYYQLWGFAAILLHLADMGYYLVYPEHRFINFDRSGKQRLGVISPNTVLLNFERGFLSFFYEAPRPLSWEDTFRSTEGMEPLYSSKARSNDLQWKGFRCR